MKITHGNHYHLAYLVEDAGVRPGLLLIDAVRIPVTERAVRYGRGSVRRSWMKRVVFAACKAGDVKGVPIA